jgi:DNA-binding transcriptional ArsR family regulator
LSAHVAGTRFLPGQSHLQFRDTVPTATSLKVLRGASQAASVLHETRRALIEHLAEPDSAAGLARKLKTSRQRVRYHVQQLEREGLVECVAERRNGNCVERLLRATARTYVISPEAIGSLGDSPVIASDRFSAGYLLASAARVVRDVGALEARARAESRRLATLTLQGEVRFASVEQRAAFASDLTDMLAQLIARYHDDEAPDGRRYQLTVLAHPAAARAPGDVPGAVQADGGGSDA